MTEQVILHHVEIFRAGTFRGIPYDELDLSQAQRMFSYVRDHATTAKARGLTADPEVPVLLGHKGTQVGRVVSIDDIGDRLVADLEVPAEVADAIANGQLTAVSAHMAFEAMALHCKHVALLTPDQPPAVYGLRPLMESLPKEYANV